MSRGCQLSPRASYDYNPDEELDDEVTQALGKMSPYTPEKEDSSVFVEQSD